MSKYEKAARELMAQGASPRSILLTAWAYAALAAIPLTLGLVMGGWGLLLLLIPAALLLWPAYFGFCAYEAAKAAA